MDKKLWKYGQKFASNPYKKKGNHITTTVSVFQAPDTASERVSPHGLSMKPCEGPGGAGPWWRGHFVLTADVSTMFSERFAPWSYSQENDYIQGENVFLNDEHQLFMNIMC